MKLPAFVAATAVTVTLITPAALADCNCGYLDPSTQALWTERTITYWNETASAASDLLLDPSESPAWQGEGTAGSTGNGNQSWVIGSAPVDGWEEGFSSTWRAGYDSSNVRLINQTGRGFRGLGLDVAPAEISNHTSLGSVVISRRRDILYGSFRTLTQVPNGQYGGSAFVMQARFNQSETVDLGLYAGDYSVDKSTVRWSYSASGHPATPVITILTMLSADGDSNPGFLEHRFDWSRIPGITFSNSATVAAHNSSGLLDGGWDHHVPTTPSVFAYRHYATGEISESQGPPIGGVSTAQIVYSRFFFNSSSPARQQQFAQRCLAQPEPLCSTDDVSLRGSTPFDPSVSGVQYVPPPFEWAPQTWSVICLSVCLGISLLLFLHALARRAYTKRQKVKAWKAEQAAAGPSPTQTYFGGGAATPHRGLSAAPSYSDFHSSHHSDLFDLQSLHHGGNPNGPASALSVDPKFEAAFDTWAKHRQSALATGHELDTSRDDDDDNQSDWDEYEDEKDAKFTDSLDNNFSTIVTLPFAAQPRSTGHGSTLLSPALSGRFSFITVGKEQAGLVRRWKRRGDTAASRSGPGAADNADVDSYQANLAEPTDAETPPTNTKPRPTVRVLLNRFAAFLGRVIFVDENNIGTTSTGQNKVAYLGSLRGFATLAVTLGHWTTMYMNMPLTADGAWSPNFAVHYPRMFIYVYKMTFSVVLGGAASFRVAMFFVLPARILGTRYLLRGGLANLADSSVRRMPRIMFPVFMAALLEYFLIEVSTFRWLIRLPSRTWNTWSYYENYANLGEFINSFISLWFVAPPQQPALVQRYAIGILWTVPLMIQLTWSLFLCAIIARQIPHHGKRWAFYSICIGLNWYADRFDTLFLLGLAVADLDAKLNYRSWPGLRLWPASLEERFATLRKCRIPAQLFAWILFFVGFGFAWCEVSGKGPSDLTVKELRIRPDFFTGNPRGWADPDLTLAYNDLKFTCILPVLSFYLLCDLNKYFAKAFSLRIWQVIGKHSFGVFLLHGAVFWSWGSFCMVNLLVAGLPYWAANLINFITSYALLAVCAVIFTNTADKWGAWISVALWRSVSRGYGRREK